MITIIEEVEVERGRLGFIRRGRRRRRRFVENLRGYIMNKRKVLYIEKKKKKIIIIINHSHKSLV
jgi:hypothetical protein